MPFTLLLHAQMVVCAAEVKTEGYNSSGKARAPTWKVHVVADSPAREIIWPVSDITGTPQSRCWVWELAQGHTAAT